ncbi:MAG TPA: COX15/CtaA family protein [Gemmatimonadaceae bacterium]|nr:COX15/CtaA family protein [Gemmatimonadaceae bacterium]
MTLLRRLALLALLLGFAQVVFGALVRITGSGMGCGDHWPDCYGSFTPAHNAPSLLVEISHRYGAAALSIAILALAATAYAKRRESGVSGPGGVLRPAGLAVLLVVVAALFGAVTVKMELSPAVVVTHLAIAMSLLAVLVVAAVRTGALGERSSSTPSGRTVRAARAAAALTFIALVLGALTANTPGAPTSCQGFPWCRVVGATGTPLVIQASHRIVAFLLFGHLIGAALGARKRGEGALVRRAAWTALSLVVLQVIVAAAMVEMHLPASFRSVHQAVGTALWIAVVALAAFAAGRRAPVPVAEAVRESPSRGEFATPEGVST